MNAAYLKQGAVSGLLAGLALFTGLIAWQGIAEVGLALAGAGAGLLVVTAFHLVPMIADTLAWRALIQGPVRPGFPSLLHARWLGESVNGLLPVAQIGGNVLKIHLLMQGGVKGDAAGASVILDLTLAVLTQVAFTLLGLAILLTLGLGQVAMLAGAGLALSATLVAGFILVQHQAPAERIARHLERLMHPERWAALVGGARGLDARVRAGYRQHRALAVAAGWRLAGWLLGTGEVWLALYFLGMPVSFVEALLLESLGQAVRASGFLIPGALGIQEGGYLLLGGLLGLNPEISLALSLSKRVRELLLGIPGLISWQLGIARRWFRGRRAAAREERQDD